MNEILKEMQAWGASTIELLREAGLTEEEVAEVLADEYSARPAKFHSKCGGARARVPLRRAPKHRDRGQHRHFCQAFFI